MTDILITMREDLKRALSKDPAARRWAMLIDTRKCVGCRSCTIGCISEHKLPPSVEYRHVTDAESGAYPDVARTFLPSLCRQCDDPECVEECRYGATWKETEGIAAGTVVIDYLKCHGCGECVEECPYHARRLDRGGSFDSPPSIWETAKFWEYGRAWQRDGDDPPVGKARKCHFCTDRLANGLLPVCVTTCIGRANYFGDENDPASLIAQVKAASVVQTLEREGTRPRVYFVAREALDPHLLSRNDDELDHEEAHHG